MKTIITLLLSSFLLATSCSKEETPEIQTDGSGVVISKPYIWKRSLHLSNSVSNSGITAQVYYGNNFLSPITNGGNNRKLALINSDNGNIIWQWDDRYQPETEYMDIGYYHHYQNLFTYQVGGRSYCINLDNGTTHWKIRRDSSFDTRIYQNSNNFYFYLVDIVNENGYNEQIANIADIQTGVLTTSHIRANLSNDYIQTSTNTGGGVTDVIKLPDSHNLFAVTYAEPLPNWEINSFLGLYNSETHQWVWERKLMAPPSQITSVFTPPKIYNNKIYANVGNYIVCHDLISGEQLWSRTFTADFMFSGFIIEEGKLIGSCENEKLYCLNSENGNIIWVTQGSGTSSRLAYLNGVVYFSGGGDGFLHAVDVSNGKTLWKLNAGNIDGSAFAAYNPVYVLPAQNGKPARVFAHTMGNVVCYEAVR